MLDWAARTMEILEMRTSSGSHSSGGWPLQLWRHYETNLTWIDSRTMYIDGRLKFTETGVDHVTHDVLS